jgi:hypothetical protein
MLRCPATDRIAGRIEVARNAIGGWHEMRLEDVPRRRERLILADVVLKLTRIFNQAVVRAPAHADVVHVIQAVYFGHLSGRPMTAHKISMFINMPRTSVLRRLAFLIRNGYVQKKENSTMWRKPVYGARQLILMPPSRQSLRPARSCNG